jgi:hypothetical protein
MFYERGQWFNGQRDFRASLCQASFRPRVMGRKSPLPSASIRLPRAASKLALPKFPPNALSAVLMPDNFKSMSMPVKIVCADSNGTLTAFSKVLQ